MRTFALLAVLTAVAAADTERLVFVADSAVEPITELRGSAKAASNDFKVANEDELGIVTNAGDALCTAAETALQKLVEADCNVTNVACAYKSAGKCDNWCNPDTTCGYVQDNDFVKFHSYECNLAVDTSKGFDASSVICKPEFTPLGVGSLVAVVLLALGCCCCCIWCCCCRSRR